MNYWAESGCPKSKLVMGMPLYGQSFTLTNAKVDFKLLKFKYFLLILFFSGQWTECCSQRRRHRRSSHKGQGVPGLP